MPTNLVPPSLKKLGKTLIKSYWFEGAEMPKNRVMNNK